MVCENLSGETCRILKEKCFKLGKETGCDFLLYYNIVKNRSQDTPLAREAKARLEEPLIQSWKEYAKSPAPGKKRMTAQPFEKAIRATIKEQLSPLSAMVTETGKNYPFWKTINIIADCLIEKDRCPDSILSMKTWLGPEQLRETYAYAYFAKTWHGQKNIRVYMVIFQPIESKYHDLITLCEPYVDGVYSLSGEPYVDDLLAELRRIYV